MDRRLRGQRISRQELIEESRRVLDEAGVANNARAKFVTEIARIVVGSTEPIYTQLQPKIIQHDTQAWVKAFALMFQYLNDHNLTETIAAIEAEFGQGPLPNEVLEDQGIDSDTQMNELLAGIPKETPFRARVLEFMERNAKPKVIQKPKLQPKRKSPRKESPKSGQKSISVRSPNREDQILIGLFGKNADDTGKANDVTPKRVVHKKARRTPGRKQSPAREASQTHSKEVLDEDTRKPRKAVLRKRKTKPAPAKPKMAGAKTAQDEELLDDFVIDVVIPANGQ